MIRRQFVAGKMAVVLVGMAGCLGNRNNPDTSDEITVEAVHRSTNIFEDEDVIAELSNRHRPASYQALITDRREANDRLRSREETDAFIQETDFDDSYLVAVVAVDWSSDYTLELVKIERTEAGFHVLIESEAPSGDVSMDASPHSLLIRVTDERSELPNEISVEIDGENAGTNKVANNFITP